MNIRFRTWPFALGFALIVANPVLSQAPPEVQNLSLDAASTLAWDAASGADHYNVYRTRVADLAAGAPRCHGFEIAGATYDSPEDPPSGDAWAYLVTAESNTTGEGTPGLRSDAGERPLLGSCATVMRNHVLGRVGWGWDEWSQDRVEALGLVGYIDEQLNPLSFSENPELNAAMLAYKPPVEILDLIGQLTVRQVYSYRQLEWQLAAFWSNHFNTFWGKVAEIFNGVYPQCQQPNPLPQCDANFPEVSYKVSSSLTDTDVRDYRVLALNGTMRDMLERNTLSAPMILYLDTYTSVTGNPNENYSRELLELLSMGVGGGYTQADVEELSRVFTGWTLCKKEFADVNDPLAPCIADYWIEPPFGRWVAAPGGRETTTARQKTLFAGTPLRSDHPRHLCDTRRTGSNDSRSRT